MQDALWGLGKLLARYISKEVQPPPLVPISSAENLLACLKPGDVLLVEGRARVSVAIKYLTQSTWSHAALFVGFNSGYDIPEGHCFVEADTELGVRTLGIEDFTGYNTRICRPVGLSEEDCKNVIAHAMDRLGYRYDLRNVIDLLRYLISTPPVPEKFRRRMIALGSGDPTRAICSTLIAEAFQTVGYPILPIIEIMPEGVGRTRRVKEILHIRHHSLFVPRDFDISPFFKVIKPTVELGFDYKALVWGTPYDPAHAHPLPENSTQKIEDQHGS